MYMLDIVRVELVPFVLVCSKRVRPFSLGSFVRLLSGLGYIVAIFASVLIATCMLFLPHRPILAARQCVPLVM